MVPNICSTICWQLAEILGDTQLQFQKAGAVAKRPDFLKADFSLRIVVPIYSLFPEKIPFISLVGVFCNHPDKRNKSTLKMRYSHASTSA